MIRQLNAAALLAIGATIAAPTANAQFTNACAGTDFYSCVTLAVSGQGTNTLLFTVTNTSNAGLANNPNSEFMEFGVVDSLFTGTAPMVTANGALSSRFTVSDANANSYHGAGFSNDHTTLLGLTANAPSPTNGLHDGESVGFFLAFTNLTDANAFLSGFQFAVHDQQGFDDCSVSSKAVFSNNGTPAPGSSSPTSAATCNGPSTVPEPSSMALLGTGLFGLIPMMRKRRK